MLVTRSRANGGLEMSEDQGPENMGRRKFLGAFVAAVAAVVAAALAIPLVGYFLSPAFARAGRRVTVAIARTSEIPVGTPTFIAYEEAVRDGWLTTTSSKGAWVVNKGGDQFIVYDPHCTHLGCSYYWDAARQIFLCPCHDGWFDIDGKVLGGPPPRPLDRLSFIIDNGAIEITTT